MPDSHVNVPYQPFGTESPNLEGRNNYLTARATPQTAVGEQVERFGRTAQKVGEEYTNYFGGLVAETAANQAEVGYKTAVGDLRAKFMQYEGMEAQAKLPEYDAALSELHEKYRSNLPALSQRMFDNNTLNSLTSQKVEYAGYAATQLKKANVQSQKDISSQAIASAANLSTVLDEGQFNNSLGTITHSANAVADMTGLGAFARGTDPSTGQLLFSDTPEGKNAEASYRAILDEERGKFFTLATKTVSDNMGAAAGGDWAQKHWDRMPDYAKVQLNQYLAPKLKNEAIASNVITMLGDIDKDYHGQIVASVPSGPLQLSKEQKNPLDVIRDNEGIGYSKDSKGEVINGLNSIAFPTEFAEAKKILDTQGQAAATKYVDDFFQKNIIDKYDINSLPAETRNIVADGLVNHGGGEFGQSLIAAAKNGATPQQLIDMRRSEYQRLASSNPEQYGRNLNGWLNRLDKFSAPTTPGNKADFLKANEDRYVNDAVSSYLEKYPDDNAGAMTQERRARTEINRIIKQEDAKLKIDRDMITNVIVGSSVKGSPIQSYQALRQIPGMGDALDRAIYQQPEFFHKIDGMIATGLGTNEKDVESYGSAIGQTLQGIWNGTINDNQTLQKQLASGQLTISGYEKANKELMEASKPDSKTNMQLMANTSMTVRGWFGKPNEKGVYDKEDEKLWNDAQVLMMNARNDGLNNKIPLSQLYDPNSPHWVGNAAKSLVPTPDQKMQKLYKSIKGWTPPPPLNERVVGKTYQSPNGPLEWTGHGWKRPPEVPMSE